MPNDLSSAFHADLDQLKAFFLKELAKLENGLNTVLADAKTVITSVIDNAGPVVIAAAAAGVQAALANATGGLSALVSAGEAAGLAVLKAQGIQLADEALLQFETLVRTHVLKANSNPAASATPSGNQVPGG